MDKTTQATPPTDYTALPPNINQLVPSKHLTTAVKCLDELEAQYDPAIDLNSPYDDEVVEIEYRAPTKDDFLVPRNLEQQIDQDRVIHRFLPRPCDIDHLMREINRKIL